MRGIPKEEMARELLCCIYGKAFELYYPSFAQNGSLTEDAMNHDRVKGKFMGKSQSKLNTEVEVDDAIVA